MMFLKTIANVQRLLRILSQGLQHLNLTLCLPHIMELQRIDLQNMKHLAEHLGYKGVCWRLDIHVEQLTLHFF